MSKLRVSTSLLLVAGLSACGFSDLIGATRAYNYGTITHVSEHVNATKEFNESNPGVGIGSQAPLRDSKWSVGVEAGIYKNSNDENSSYVLGYFERDILESYPGAFRLGFFSGYARYPDEAERWQNKLPVFGDYIPVGGLQATFPTISPHELRVRITPGLSRSSAIVTLQSNFVF